MDRLQGMEILIKVAQVGSLSAAAERLGIAKSTISKHITALEARLGVRLVNRTTRQLALTEPGQRYVEEAAAILAQIDTTERALSADGATPGGRVRVNAPMTFGQMHLTPILLRFIDRHPEIRVDLALNDRRVDLIDEGFDVAVRIGNLEDSSLMARRLARLAYVCVASPAYLERAGTPATAADLRRHACLRYTYSPSPSEWSFERDGGVERVRVDGPFAANNGDVLTDAAVAGLGIIYTPAFIVAAALADGRLKPILADYAPRTIDMHAVFLPQRPLQAKLRVLIDFLVEACACVDCPP